MRLTIARLLSLLSTKMSDSTLRVLLTTMYKAESGSNTRLALVHYYRHFMLERTAMFALQARSFNLVTTGNDISDLQTLMGNSLDLGLHEELDHVIAASIQNITVEKDASAHFLLIATFVSEYITAATTHLCSLPAGQHLVTLLLSRAGRTYISRRPHRPADWKRIAKDHVFKHVEQAHVKMMRDRSSEIRPSPLIFTKTTFEYDAEMKIWAREFKNFQKAWEKLDNNAVKQMVGDKYDDLVLLARHKTYFAEHPWLIEPVAASTTTKQDPKPNHSTSPMTSKVRKEALTSVKKRKSGMIDLEEEQSLRKSVMPEKRWRHLTLSRGNRKSDPFS